jgi:hypothetical protein
VPRIVRRFLIITLCLGALGLVAWLLRRQRLPESDLSASARSRSQPPREAVDEPVSEPASESVSGSEPVDSGEQLLAELVQIRAEAVEERLVAEPAIAPERGPEHEPLSARRYDDAVLDLAGESGEQLMAELAQIRADVVERVERRPLFVMAEKRGVPFYHLFSMTKQELFEAVLEAERLPPHDVTPSPQSAARIKQIVAEAFRLDEEIAAEQTAHLAKNKTA